MIGGVGKWLDYLVGSVDNWFVSMAVSGNDGFRGDVSGKTSKLFRKTATRYLIDRVVPTYPSVSPMVVANVKPS
jgi:hypothetical protein